MLLSAKGLTKSYGGVAVVSNLDVDLASGEIRALVGENGAGKSTLIKMLSGAVAPDSGHVWLEDRLMPVGTPLGSRERGLSIVYQELTLVPELTVADNIFLGRELGRLFLRRRDMNRRAQELLNRLGVDLDASTIVRGLSIAQQQLVEISRALAIDAKVLILDEPSSTLSGADVHKLFAVLRQLRARGLAVIYVSHRLEEVFEIADTVTVLRDGRHVATSSIVGMTREELILQMVGRSLSEEFPPRTTTFGHPVLTVERFAVPPRVSDVSFVVRSGEIVGLAGLVGAGRTSTALAMVGMLPSAGRVQLLGSFVYFETPAQAIREGLAYVTEDRKGRGIFPELTLGENICITHMSAFTTAGLLSVSGARREAEAAIRDFGIRTSGADQRMGTLSGGNQQKALLARYLLKPPVALILDEPTRGVDVGARAEIYKTMNQLTSLGLGILMISSDMGEILGMSDRIVVMCEGRTVGELARGEATAESIMALATAA
jgi:ABC-type sugar transport system ATPase subunit